MTERPWRSILRTSDTESGTFVAFAAPSLRIREPTVRRSPFFLEVQRESRCVLRRASTSGGKQFEGRGGGDESTIS